VTAPQGIPAGAAGGIGLAAAAYAPQIAYYQSKFPGAVSQGSFLLAATDTMVRSFASDLSQIASEYGVYVIANDNLPDFVESADPADVGALHDPDLTSRYLNGDLSTVYVATEPQVYNTAFVWAPALDCSVTSWAWACTHADVAGPLRNLLAKNLKVNLVNEETQDLAITAGPYTTQNLQPVTIPVTGGTLRLGIATSLDAFEYDPCGTDAGVGGCASTSPLSEPPAPRGGYCAAGENVYYMECLNALGTNILIQPEANGPWASPGGGTDWQPMDWMGSAFRAVAEQAGDWRIQYSVNPFLVGNLLDLPFDGQSAIFHRTTSGAGAHYIGDETLNASDPQADGPYAGSLPQFLALAPWVGQLDPAAPSGGDDRSWDQGYSASMEPGSGVACSASGAEYGACEDGYLETAVWADITGIS
jgi:hypothetical protein